MGQQSRSPGFWAENRFWEEIFKGCLRFSKSVSLPYVRETVSGAKSVSWLQSRSAAFCGEDAFGTAGAISTRRVDSFRAKLPPCFLTRIILTRAVRDPPRVWASTTDFLKIRAAEPLTLHQTIEAARCHCGSRPFWRRSRQRRVDNAVQKTKPCGGRF